ncbi:hypothetical protein FBUS_10276 [Fasciolopsis buskii]|uniref:Uncharacterized protein n=1 Tax=Fasciolopsis buskii TaxID=27845 RepID=A0A8E0RJM6_9TREM|nr:hypothetical protein FBUS_10276 [Fasciolopsis buski]
MWYFLLLPILSPRSLTSSSPGPNEPVPVTIGDPKLIPGAHICNECELYSDHYDHSRDEDLDLTSDQTTLRREKSRVAAKLRRQKENQALVKLRLALPIQSAKLPHIGPVKGGSQLNESVFHDAHQQQQQQQQRRQQQQDPAQYRALTECALSCIPNYRAANSISRQHHLAAPEFEKAVTVRLAGNALCLYDWLYTSPSLANVAAVDRSSSVTRESHPSCSCCYGRWSETAYNGSVPSLSVFSQSLMAIVVDTIENTVVYAPPSYAQLIGISWVCLH